VAALNAALLVKADAAEAVRTGRARAGTTVAEADVACPADSGLLARAIIRITVLAACIHAAGAASRTQVRDRRRAESPPGPGPGFPASRRTRRPGWCPCTTRVTGNADGIVADCPVHDAVRGTVRPPAESLGERERCPGYLLQGRGTQAPDRRGVPGRA
jgi:hypothetical protein